VGLAFAEGPVEHFGLDRAGRDTVDADALLGEFQRSRLGEADDGELAGDVNRRAGKADVPADGGIIDDGTTTGPKYGRDFVLHRQHILVCIATGLAVANPAWAHGGGGGGGSGGAGAAGGWKRKPRRW